MDGMVKLARALRIEQPYREEVVATYKSRVLLNFIATVHPPLILHSDVLSELTKKKLRERIIREMVRLLRTQLRGSGRGGRPSPSYLTS